MDRIGKIESIVAEHDRILAVGKDRQDVIQPFFLELKRDVQTIDEELAKCMVRPSTNDSGGGFAGRRQAD